jgi:type II secretory ATPase GspE/PulE/Tfp pilus assembly ATPase PilB-like protein
MKKPTRHPGGKPPAKTESPSVPFHFDRQEWVSKSLLSAVRMKADELHFERGRDGLTVEFRKGAEVLKSMGPYKRFQDEVIPQLVRMGDRGKPKKFPGQTGGFSAGVDDRVWDIPLFHTRTKTGERMVVRFASSKPWTEGLQLRLWTKGTLYRAVAFKATEVRYERSKAGLTVKYFKGPRVLEANDYPEPFAGKMIPHLRKLAKMGPAEKDGRLAGNYHNAVWDFRVTSTATPSGERLVIRPSKAEPGKKPR